MLQFNHRNVILAAPGHNTRVDLHGSGPPREWTLHQSVLSGVTLFNLFTLNHTLIRGQSSEVVHKIFGQDLGNCQAGADRAGMNLVL